MTLRSNRGWALRVTVSPWLCFFTSLKALWRVIDKRLTGLLFLILRVRLCLLLDTDDAGGNPRFITSPQGKSGTVNLRSVDDVDDEPIGWIKEAYDKG